MPNFRRIGADKPPIPRGTFVRFELSTPVGSSFPTSRAPRVGQVWDTAPGASLWVVLPDGSAVKMHPRDATVLDEADALTLL